MTNPSTRRAAISQLMENYIRQMGIAYTGAELYRGSDTLSPALVEAQEKHTNIAIVEGDFVSVAVDWTAHLKQNVFLLLPVDGRESGGGWKNGDLGPEEHMARRSNLASIDFNFPLPENGALYCPDVKIVSPGGDEFWTPDAWVTLDVACISPVSRPRLRHPMEPDQFEEYAFEEEKILQEMRMRMALQLAVEKRHKYLCLGAFGAISDSERLCEIYGGKGRFRNPIFEVVSLWRDLLSEFNGQFEEVIFAVKPGTASTWRSAWKIDGMWAPYAYTSDGG